MTTRNVLLIAVLLTQIACGTLLYPERRNQRATGQVDYGVVLMDAAWLLVFIIPGIAALAVDFATGAIYMPSGRPQFYERRAGLGEDGAGTLVLGPAGHLVVRSPQAASAPARWRFELHAPDAPAALASWGWNGRHDLRLDVPGDVAPGAYALRVLRDERAVGHVSLRIAPASGGAG
jgi:hypothetical protein